jgi:hypothetical protein
MAPVRPAAAALLAAALLTSCTQSGQDGGRRHPGPEPSTGGWPGAETTGVPRGTHLTSVHGSYRVTTPGAVVSNLDIEGALVVQADDVTVKDTRVRGVGERDWVVTLGTRTTLVDVEVGGGASGTDGSLATGVYSGGGASGNRILRVDIHHTQDGVRLDGGTTVQDSWIHDLLYDGGAHSDGIQLTTGAGSMVLHNRIEAGNNDAVFLQRTGQDQPISDVLIEDNLLVATAAGSARSSFGVSNENGSGVVLRGNVFTRSWQVGATNGSFVAVDGNRFVDGRPLS